MVAWHDREAASRLPGRYTRDDFTNNVRTWRAAVVPYMLTLALGRERVCRVLMVGSAAEGLPVAFLRTELPAHVALRVDALTEGDPGLQLRANVRLLRPGTHTRVRQVPSLERELMRLALAATTYDLVFVGGPKGAADVLRLAALAFSCTAPGGMLVFDNYTRDARGDGACPRAGVDAFVTTHQRLLKAVGPWGWQAIVVRRRRPLATPGCASELYHEDLSKV